MRLDSASADRLTALVLFVLGASTTYGGFVMDRLEIRRIHPASIPGLVPMMIGVGLMVCALALAWSARGRRDDGPSTEYVSWPNLGVATAWSALYALAAVGRLPFAVATAVYIAGFTLWFLWKDTEDGVRPRPVAILGVLAFSAVTAVGIAALFRYGFLVRLP